MKFSQFIKEALKEKAKDINDLVDSVQAGKFTKDGSELTPATFTCCYNNLTNLSGAPKKIRNDVNFSSNSLTSLENGPEYVGKDYICANNDITSFHNVHKHIKHIGHTFYIQGNPIKSSVLGLLLIDGLERVSGEQYSVMDILNKYLPNTGGNQWVMQCQTELIEAGFREYAKL